MDVSLSLLAQLFDNLPLGVVVLDAKGEVIVYNRTEEKLAGRSRAHVIGRPFFSEIAPCMNVRQLAGEFNARIGRATIDINVEFSFPFPFMDEPRDVRVKMSSFDVANAPYAFLMIEDISTQRSIERMKETLQGFLVHDLKNPLSAVLSNLQVLQEYETTRDNQDAREAILDSIESAERLHGMIVNLLDITRLETNSLPLKLMDVDVDELLANVVRDNLANAKLRNKKVSFQPSTRMRARLDLQVVRRALDNLVENALRHAQNVTLSAELGDEMIHFEIRDDGPGIPEDLRQAIFDKYTQVVTPGAQAAHNRGLGLTFVRLAARAHGGDATVECPPTGGTVFRVSCAVDRSKSMRPPPKLSI